MVDSVQPKNCEKTHFSSEQSNFTYCWSFKWSSSALLDLMVSCNVVGEVILHLANAMSTLLYYMFHFILIIL